MADSVRFDRASLKKTAPRLFEGTVARTHAPGDGLSYATGEEYRDDAELAHMASQLATIRVVSYAQTDAENPLGHPDDLLANGAEHHEIGIVLSGRVEDGKAIASIYIHDDGALKAIEDGTKELSLGYRCGLDADRYQKNAQLDHLSIVPKARCGGICALRTDSVDDSCDCIAYSVPDAIVDLMATVPAQSETPKVDCTCKNHTMSHTNEDHQMTADPIQKNLDDALAKVAALESENTALKAASTSMDEASKLTLDSATADLKAESARADKLASEIEAVKSDAQSRIDASQNARKDADEAAFTARVDARIELLADAAKVGVEDYTAKTDREIKVAIVKKVDEMDVADAMSADYVNGMYAGAMKRHSKAAISVAEVRQVLVENESVVLDSANPLKKEAEIAAVTEAKRKNRWR